VHDIVTSSASRSETSSNTNTNTNTSKNTSKNTHTTSNDALTNNKPVVAVMIHGGSMDLSGVRQDVHSGNG
jgi:hypothetical protein